MYLYLVYTRFDIPFKINNTSPTKCFYHYIVHTEKKYKPWCNRINGRLLYTNDICRKIPLCCIRNVYNDKITSVVLPNTFIERIEYKTYERLATYHFEHLV